MKYSACAILYAISFSVVVSISTPVAARVKTSLVCSTDYGYFKHDRLHRAFAVTGGRSPYSNGPRFSCGRAWSYPSKKIAAKEAIRQCNVNKRRIKTLGVCKIISAK